MKIQNLDITYLNYLQLCNKKFRGCLTTLSVWVLCCFKYQFSDPAPKLRVSSDLERFSATIFMRTNIVEDSVFSQTIIFVGLQYWSKCSWYQDQRYSFEWLYLLSVILKLQLLHLSFSTYKQVKVKICFHEHNHIEVILRQKILILIFFNLLFIFTDYEISNFKAFLTITL